MGYLRAIRSGFSRCTAPPCCGRRLQNFLLSPMEMEKKRGRAWEREMPEP
jgi:hypothetical protein